MESPVLKKQYKEEVVKAMTDMFAYRNVHEVPQVQKVVLSMRVSSSSEKSFVEELVAILGKIAGQKPVVTKAKKSISNFKLRKGMPVGVKVDLRGDNMWEFLYTLINVVLCRIRDFRGTSRKMERGTYNIGITDVSIFPQLAVELASKKTLGLNITVVTSADNSKEGLKLLELLGMPFRQSSRVQQQVGAAA